MARLLVSVRSADEARAAVGAGASIIDVKEPARGPLGRADAAVWGAVRAAVAGAAEVTVALGEIGEWVGPAGVADRVGRDDFAGIAFRKLGLAASGPRWADDWAGLRRRLGGGPSWVAVAYADWESAAAPDPDSVLSAALAAPDCAGVLVDTWDKASSARVGPSWEPFFARARRSGRFTAVAGGLNLPSIAGLAPLRPDIVAVRGAACLGGDRLAPIDPSRVAALALAADALR